MEGRFFQNGWVWAPRLLERWEYHEIANLTCWKTENVMAHLRIGIWHKVFRLKTFPQLVLQVQIFLFLSLPSELVWLKICYLDDFKMGFATLWMTYIVRERAKKNMISGLLIKSDISGQCLCITYCKVHILWEGHKKHFGSNRIEFPPKNMIR